MTGGRGRRWVRWFAAPAVGAALVPSTSACGGGGGSSGQVGQCAKDARGDNDITIIDCTDGDAKYKIVGVDEHVSSGGADASCFAYKDATKTLWFGSSGDFGRVLCLQELQK